MSVKTVSEWERGNRSMGCGYPMGENSINSFFKVVMLNALQIGAVNTWHCLS